jgi:hypothetical protein
VDHTFWGAGNVREDKSNARQGFKSINSIPVCCFGCDDCFSNEVSADPLRPTTRAHKKKKQSLSVINKMQSTARRNRRNSPTAIHHKRRWRGGEVAPALNQLVHACQVTRGINLHW